MLNILLAKIIAATFDFYSSEMFINLSPFPPPPTVCSNAKSNIATLINDREFITSTRPNSTHEMQARKVAKC